MRPASGIGRIRALAYPCSREGEDLRNHQLRRRGRRGRARRLGDRADPPRASPRYCEPERAAAIGAAFRRRCEIAGVFVNPTLDEVAAAVENAGLTAVQLNGEEGPSLCAEIARRTGAKVIKAIHLSSGADLQAAEAYPTDFHLFDPARLSCGAAPGGRSTGISCKAATPRCRRSSPAG